MSVTFDIKVKKNDGGFDALYARVRAGGDAKIDVGVHREDTERENSGLTNGELAQIHEFGTETVPPRPFLRPTFFENNAKYKKRGAELYRAYLHGKEKSVHAALGKLGIEMVADIRRRIVKVIDPRLVERTLRAKRRAGFPRPGIPLLATMQLFYSIRSRIVK